MSANNISNWQHFLLSIQWEAVIKSVFLIICAHFVARYACLGFKKITDNYLKLDHHQIYLTERVIFYTIWVLFILMAAQHLGFSLNILLGATGIFTIALGFASQTSVSNLISGIFLIMEKPFKVGDTITIGEITGEVLAIDALSAKLKTPDNTYVRIPNEILIKSNIINLSHYTFRRIDIFFELAPHSANACLLQELLDYLMTDPRCLVEPRPFIQIESFSTTNLKVHLGVYTSNDQLGMLKNDLHLLIFEYLNKHNLTIAMPHQTIIMSKNNEKFENSR